jgi:hypothetical protein
VQVECAGARQDNCKGPLHPPIKSGAPPPAKLREGLVTTLPQLVGGAVPGLDPGTEGVRATPPSCKNFGYSPLGITPPLKHEDTNP